MKLKELKKRIDAIYSIERVRDLDVVISNNKMVKL